MGYSLTGVYASLSKRGSLVDFCTPRIWRKRAAARYKALMSLPAVPLGRDRTEAAKICRRGGTLTAEARFGWNNERGYAEPSSGIRMQEVFGRPRKEGRYREKAR